jgi:poly(hydroxyalkanoate) depolymerase family esterase
VKDTLRNLMLRVTRFARRGGLREATAAIQRAFARPAPAPRPDAEVVEDEITIIEDHELRIQPAPVAPPAPDEGTDGEFIAGLFGNAAGTRDYRLYVPSGAPPNGRALVVMLHGCKQNPDDFALGTGMNRRARPHGCLVLYPGQSRLVNSVGCWNWFQPDNQQRDRGEPSIIADLTRHVIASHAVDPQRVYVAGLSAGGAMAAIMAATYPELYAAVGIHSGLAHAAAHDLVSALKAMRIGPAPRDEAPASGERRVVPTIVFHGDLDETVHPDNGDQVIAQTRPAAGPGAAESAEAETDGPGAVVVERGAVAQGHAYTRTIHRDARGCCDAEHWLVHGAAHAWSGGQPGGSYTDPLGPDASAEMLRFFLEHPQRD